MDPIDRQSAIEIVDRYNKSHMMLMGKPMLGAASIMIELEDLPTIEPERKTGTWVSVGCVVPDIANVPMIKCTVCGHLEPDVDAARTPYCSHCGSRMRGVPEDV